MSPGSSSNPSPLQHHFRTGEAPLGPVDLDEGQVLDDPEEGGARGHHGATSVGVGDALELVVDTRAQVAEEGEEGLLLPGHDARYVVVVPGAAHQPDGASSESSKPARA